MRLIRWLNGFGERPTVWLAVISADSQIDRLLDEASQAVSEWSEHWDPQCNIFEDSDEFTVQMALPGMNGAITDYAPICVLSIGARGWRGLGSVPSPHNSLRTRAPRFTAAIMRTCHQSLCFYFLWVLVSQRSEKVLQ